MMDRGSFDQPAMLAIALRFDALEVASHVRDVKESMLLLKILKTLRLTNSCLSGVQCHYSYRANLGKPKGSLNKKTLERLRRNAEQQSTNVNSENNINNDRNNQFSGSAGSMDCDQTFSVCDPITTLSSIAPQQQTPLSPASLDDILGNGSIGPPGSSAFPDLPAFEGTMPDFSDSVLPQFSPRMVSILISPDCNGTCTKPRVAQPSNITFASQR